MSGSATKCDEDEDDFRSDDGEEGLTEADIETMRRELTEEINELEWEFRTVKETLYAERIAQIDRKLQQLKSSEAPELKQITALVDEAYHIRRQVAKHRRDFELEVANKELDNALQMVDNDSHENRRTAEERIRTRLQESICTLQIERALANRHKRLARIVKSKSKAFSFDTSRIGTKDHPLKSLNLSTTQSTVENTAALMVKTTTCQGEYDNNDDANDCQDDRLLEDAYLPGKDLEPRRKPVPLSPSLPRLVYELDEEDIRTDLQAIMNAVKEHKLTIAMTRLKAEKRES